MSEWESLMHHIYTAAALQRYYRNRKLMFVQGKVLLFEYVKIFTASSTCQTKPWVTYIWY